MLKRKLCRGMAARDYRSWQAEGECWITKAGGMAPGIYRCVILCALRGMLQGRERGSGTRWGECGRWHSGFKALILPRCHAKDMGWISLLPSPELGYLVLKSLLEHAGSAIKLAMRLILQEVEATQTGLVSACHYPHGELGIPVPGADSSSQATFSMAQHWICSSLV